MELIVLTVPACPNAAAFETRLTAALAAHPGAIVHRREIADEREAADAGMHGSPTLLINGTDPFAAPGQPPSLSCRGGPAAGTGRGQRGLNAQPLRDHRSSWAARAGARRRRAGRAGRPGPFRRVCSVTARAGPCLRGCGTGLRGVARRPGAGPAGTLRPLIPGYRQLPCLWWRGPGRRASWRRRASRPASTARRRSARGP